MSFKQVLLFHEDPSLQPRLEQRLGASGTIISIQRRLRAKRKIAKQSFPFIIVEARKNWYRDLKRCHHLNGNLENTTILVAPASFLHHQSDCLESLAHAVFGNGIEKTPASTPAESQENLCLENFVERKLRDFVKHMKRSGVRNLYPMLLAEVERPLISYILKETKGNQIQAARLLGMNRNTLRKKIKDLKIIHDQPKKTLSRT